MKNLFSNLQRKTIRSEEFYFETAQTIGQNLEKISKLSKNSLIDIKFKRKEKQFQIPRGTREIFSFDNLFFNNNEKYSRKISSSFTSQIQLPCGSIETFIGDISIQNVMTEKEFSRMK